MNVTALFAGIGGFEIGLSAQGHRTSLFCELDPDAASVLAVQFPGVPILPDVRRRAALVGAIDPRSDLLTAGFPCTDLSQAGNTKGFEGGRSSLIREVLELLRARPFPHVLIENVPNWRHLHRGAYLAEVVGALERLGYQWAYRTVDARAFGLPQRRRRLFLLASLETDPAKVLFGGDGVPDDDRFALDEAAHGFYWTEGNRGLGWGEDCVPTLKGGSAVGIPAPPAILMPDGAIVTPHIRDALRLQGFPADWLDLDSRHQSLGGGAFNARKSWLLVGNAVSVRVSAWLGERLSRRGGDFDAEGTPLPEDASWPAAAWFDGRRRRTAAVGSWPAVADMERLASFLQHPPALLSARATRGFFSRISASRLRFRPGFREAVERHLQRMEGLDRFAGARRAA